MSSRPILNVDLDGVVYPFVDVFRRYLVDRGVEGAKSPSTRWDVWNDWGMTEAQWISWFQTAVNDGVVWTQGDPIRDSVDELWRLSDDYHIRIVTNRLVLKYNHKKTITDTVNWLDKHSVPYRSIAMLGGESKNTLDGHALIDDSPTNITEYKRGLAILYDQPWNWSAHTHEAVRAYGWQDVGAVLRIRKAVGNVIFGYADGADGKEQD